jgi:two-component system, chemotaxis family, sensor kinase CheA
MSDFSLDDELVLDYLAESREHLATIETDLLAIEQAGAAIDEQLVNRVFRAAHSIKGGAGFFDLLQIKELAHRTENVLDLVRSRQMTPDSAIVSILLLAFDKLRSLLENYRESNNADISEFTAALTRLTEDHLRGEEKSSPGTVIAIRIPDRNRELTASVFDLDQARRAGKTIYAIEYDLIHDVQRRAETPLDVLNRLMKCGSLLSTAFDLESAGTLDEEPSSCLMFDCLYATALDAYSVAQILDILPGQIHRIENPGAAEKIAAVKLSAQETPAPVAPAASVAAPPSASAELPAPPLPSPAASPSTASPQIEATVRLNVTLLDSLMTLAGELVLGRNQLNESIRNNDAQGIGAGAHRVSLVTSELQETVSLTRMQPVSTLFSKFPRLVRDLAGQLGKDIQLRLEGGEVELDKTIIEGLSDPLTHMVRNSVDHGIELPAMRAAAGKPAQGTVTLRARHQAGQVMIEISDDGKGLATDKIVASALSKGLITAEQLQTMPEHDRQALVFLPGVSTAKEVSNVSGRGVGMDVVKTNLDKLGGKVEIESAPGRGSSFRIKLPLTLAIIPSLLISDSGERFAIPQVSVCELIGIPARHIAERIDRVGDAEVVLVRDRLVPLVHLSDALGRPRQERASKTLNVVLVDAGSFEYGLVVENLHDSVEIVVKPMGRHLQGLGEYAGATILGDGQVAVILDVAGLAQRTGMSRASAAALNPKAASEEAAGDLHSLLVFSNSPGERCAVPIDLVTRVERVSPAQVEYLGGRRTMQYNGASLPLVALRDVASAGELAESRQWVVVVFDCAGQTVGLLASEPLDMIETPLAMDTVTLRQPGIAGSALLNGTTTLMLDIFELSAALRRGKPGPGVPESALPSGPAASKATVLVAEDSDFFRGQIKRLIESVGYKVIAAEDGQSAWELLDSNANEVSVVTTDVDMPRLDGLGLTKRIRADARFARLPVIALSTLAAEEEMARGLAMGVTEYQVKLDQNQLIDSIRRAVGERSSKQAPLAA